MVYDGGRVDGHLTHEASGPMAGRLLLEGRRLVSADVLDERAAGLEAAAGRRVEGVGDLALQNDPLARPLQRRVRYRHARQQRLGVRMERRVVDHIGVGELDQLSGVEDGDAVGDVAHDGEIVGDEQVGDAELALKILEQVDDLRPHRHIERRDRLVGDDEVGS